MVITFVLIEVEGPTKYWNFQKTHIFHFNGCVRACSRSARLYARTTHVQISKQMYGMIINSWTAKCTLRTRAATHLIWILKYVMIIWGPGVIWSSVLNILQACNKFQTFVQTFCWQFSSFWDKIYKVWSKSSACLHGNLDHVGGWHVRLYIFNGTRGKWNNRDIGATFTQGLPGLAPRVEFSGKKFRLFFQKLRLLILKRSIFFNKKNVWRACG